jgi:tetratricopeptide (TPR) repeat protein
VGAGAVWLRARSTRSELAQARQAISAGRFSSARERLDRLAGQWSWSDRGEVLVLLGECALGLHRREEALAVWARVPPSSPFFARASLLRATHLINSGRYAPAEEILLKALARPTEDVGYELERALSRLYRFEGRQNDVRRVLRSAWCGAPDPAGVLKELFVLDQSPIPAEALQLALEKADDSDDRVWLGRANHATLGGRFNEAASWLERCLMRRPDDPVVWEARLDVALATEDVAGVWEAARHLRQDRFDARALHGFRAWLAARGGDHALERAELLSSLQSAPADTLALERLAVLSVQAGHAREAEQLRRRKAELDRATDRFRKIILLDSLEGYEAELSELARKLARSFEATGWSLVQRAKLLSRQATAAQHASAGDPAPFPPELRQEAVALSAPYAIDWGRESQAAAPLLTECLADLRRTDSGDLERGAASTTSIQNRKSQVQNREAVLEFVDDAEAVGLRFVFDNGRTPLRQLPETMSGGVALLDYDGDGCVDVYCVQGGPLDAGPKTAGSELPPGDRLFRNRGDGTFDDATESSGIAAIAWGAGYGMGVAVGDYDNDGACDVFVTRLRSYSLYHNHGDGTFQELTRSVGLAGARDCPTSAAFADLDGDGDLDLYVCHYMVWDPAHPRLCRNEQGEYFYCDPSKVDPAPDHVFRNDGGRFVEVTQSAGLAESSGRGLGVLAADLDGDHLIDLYVANDGTANYLFHNQGNFRFQEMALVAGVAGSASGGYQAGMGVACGDLDGDGLPDLMVTNFYGEGATHYQNLGGGLFADRSTASGIAAATRYLLGFGIAFADVNNDGRPDVAMTNGHVNDNRPFYRYGMPSRLYENRPGGRLVDVSAQAGDPWNLERVGRGLAAGDVDNDGRLDVVVLAQNEPLAYFHNRTHRPGHFASFRPEGTTCNRDGVGAVIIVTAGGIRQVAQRQGGGSYQSTHDSRLHFGLGGCREIESVELRWPSGRQERFSNLRAGMSYLLREGRPPGAEPQANAIPPPFGGLVHLRMASHPRPWL